MPDEEFKMVYKRPKYFIRHHLPDKASKGSSGMLMLVPILLVIYHPNVLKIRSKAQRDPKKNHNEML